MSGAPDEAGGGRRRLIPGRYWRAAERGWYVLLCVVVLLVIGGAVVAGASVSPAFCGLCHAAHTSQLAQSGHADIDCDACHTGPDPFDTLGSRVAVIGMTWEKFLPGTDHEDSFVPSERCLVCHEDGLRRTEIARGIRMNHTGLDPAVYPCTQCHPTTAHGTASYRQTGYNMDTCLPCHNTNPSNAATCEICHPEGAPSGGPSAPASGTLPTPWEVSHGANARSTHGMGDLATCKACHAAEYCISCHELQLPHPEGYLGLHGEQAGALGTEGCLTCHKQASCDDCHGVEMPHPADFLKAHPEIAAGAPDDVCVRCHTAESCDECHVRSTHPGLDPAVRDLLRERPAS